MRSRLTVSSFHTTMVLTQQQRPQRRNLYRNMFPYHYGSHATSPKKAWIYCKNQKFPYHYGSHATHLGDWTSQSPASRFHTTMVLTQLIVDESLVKKVESSFHTTMVLTQPETLLEELVNAMSTRFPYHYGSHATGKGNANKGVGYVFPYHYGSYATKVGAEYEVYRSNVSIPLWFLRNGARERGRLYSST